MTDWPDDYHCPVSERGFFCTEAKEGAARFKAALRQARIDALEEAARAVEATRDDGFDKFARDEYARNYGRALASDCADAIRSLKDKQP